MQNFLGLEPEYSNFLTAKYCIFPVPYERTTTYGTGTRLAPEAIVEASQQVELYDEELDAESYRVGIFTMPRRDFSVNMGIPDCLATIYHDVQNLLQQDKFIISLGGEHSITYPLVRAFVEKYPKLTVLQLDAHADLRAEYQDSHYNHACVMARVHELAPVVGIGIRSLSREEKFWIDQDHLPMWFAYQMHSNPNWMDGVLATLHEPIYITLDVDYFDPAIIPTTGTPEPGGMLWSPTLQFLRRVFTEKKIVGFDVVELAPKKDFHAADFLVAKLIYKMIGFHEAGK